MQAGAGACVVGCTATVENVQVKLSIWPSAHVCADGSQAESLTGLDASAAAGKTLTATFSPGGGFAELASEPALPTCAVALGDAVARGKPIGFQINRCMLDPPLDQDQLFTQKGRAFMKNCRLRDQTGGADVDAVEAVVPTLFGCAT